jgi:hypothetical protein
LSDVVLWAGKPDYWSPPDRNSSGDVEGFQLAATDDGVVDVLGYVSPYLNEHKITREAAINCMDRYSLRMALHSRFNPEWESFEWRNGSHVVKAPASSLSNGVTIVKSDKEEIDRLKLLGVQKLRGVIEEFVEGDAIEISGFRLKGETFFFGQVRQRWSTDWSKIEWYCATDPYRYWWLPGLTDKALDDVKLDNSCFCVEWRVIGYKQAKVLEINPRWGEDGNGYCVTARGGADCDWVEREARRILGVQ